MTTQHLAPSIYPVLRYAHPAAAIQFLVDAFGFREHEVHKGPDGEIAHAELSFGNGMVMLGPSGAGEAVLATGPESIYVVADDVDALHDRAVAAGAEIVYPLTDQDYGSRDFAAKDPSGNVWSFGTYRPTLTRA
ncbi:MAG: VOC family protein [Acidimicrobiales bacterium]